MINPNSFRQHKEKLSVQKHQKTGAIFLIVSVLGGIFSLFLPKKMKRIAAPINLATFLAGLFCFYKAFQNTPTSNFIEENNYG